jgi:hypothetical protein
MAGYAEYGLAAQAAQGQSFFDQPGQFVIQPVRVRFTFLDPVAIKNEYPKLFDKYGSYDTLGGILFEPFSNPIVPTSDVFEDNLIFNYNFAKPLFPNIRQVPLLNEITYIVSFPSTRTQDPRNIDLNQTDYYYFQPINLWNTLHQNAFPDPLIDWNAETESQPKNISYQRAEAGASTNSDAPPPEIDLGNTFVERSNIKYLQPYEGDIIYEGRWGHSIRFGSTVLNQNPWSRIGENGDPILILRNGQAPSETEAWIPTIEEINKDLGSIYFGSTQQLPLEVASSNYDSYQSNPPTIPNQYSGSQIIVTSGRLVFNSLLDHILLSSNMSINLNAIESINVDTDTMVIQTGKLYLGDKEADEPLLLGNQTVDLLEELIDSLQSFMNTCQTLVGVPAGVLMAPLNQKALTINTTLTALKTRINNQELTSKDNFTI